jgi:hypothetical protein
MRVGKKHSLMVLLTMPIILWHLLRTVGGRKVYRGENYGMKCMEAMSLKGGEKQLSDGFQ